MSECAVCRKVVKDEDNGIECDSCKEWVHSKCAEVPLGLYSALSKYEGKKGGCGIFFYCEKCKGNLLKMREELTGLKERVNVLEKEWKDTNKKIGERGVEIEERKKVELESVWNEIELIKKEGNETKISFAEIMKEEKRLADKEQAGITSMNVGINKGGGERQLQMEMAEAIERDKRRNKLVMMGIPESNCEVRENDIVREVLDCLVGETKVEFENLGRIGRKGDRARPVRILIVDNTCRRKLLARAKKLKDMTGKDKIYIAPDLTRKQQDEDRVLREEVRRRKQAGEQRVYISKGVVVIGDLVNQGDSLTLSHNLGEGSSQSKTGGQTKKESSQDQPLGEGISQNKDLVITAERLVKTNQNLSGDQVAIVEGKGKGKGIGKTEENKSVA